MINAFIVVVVVVVWFGDTVLFLFGLFLFGQKGALAEQFQISRFDENMSISLDSLSYRYSRGGGGRWYV